MVGLRETYEKMVPESPICHRKNPKDLLVSSHGFLGPAASLQGPHHDIVHGHADGAGDAMAVDQQA